MGSWKWGKVSTRGMGDGARVEVRVRFSLSVFLSLKLGFSHADAVGSVRDGCVGACMCTFGRISEIVHVFLYLCVCICMCICIRIAITTTMSSCR